MRHCVKCGTEIGEGWKFCKECGAPVMPDLGTPAGQQAKESLLGEVLAGEGACTETTPPVGTDGEQQAAGEQSDQGDGLPVRLEFNRSRKHKVGAYSLLEFRLHNLRREPLRAVELLAQCTAFGTVTTRLPEAPPGRACLLKAQVKPAESALGVQMEVRLRGEGLCHHLSRLEGNLEISIAEPGSAPYVQIVDQDVRVNTGHIVGDGATFSTPISVPFGGPGVASGRLEASPVWEEVPLELVQVFFPADLESVWEEFLSHRQGTAVYEGCRQGTMSGTRPRDVWVSRSFRKVAEKQSCPFGQAPEGVYRVELFEREGGRFLAIAYERREAGFLSHWYTNDREYARKYRDIFGLVS